MNRSLHLLLYAFMLNPVAHSVHAAFKVTQYGITWTFNRDAKAGRFVTGDWWVVGPVTVVSVFPAPDSDRHGSVVNPPAGETQGYDLRCANYESGLRAVFPLTLRPGQSLVTVDSVKEIGIKTPDTVSGQYCRGPLRTAAVLTCLDKPPPEGAFRPAYVGDWKQVFSISQLKQDVPKLSPVKTRPDINLFERYLERIWLDHQREWVNRKMHPLENMPDYGREITSIVSTVGLMCLLDDPGKEYETIRHRFIQKGIDYYGAALSNNDLWTANGGHNSGRKWPILYAGYMLNHDSMKNVEASFQEDQQTYYGKGFKGQKVLWTITARNPNAHHEEADPETWGTTFGDKRGNNGNKAEGYRKLNGPTWVGQALAARITGMDTHWNHPAYFDYVDRWIKEGGGPHRGFVHEMWRRYRERNVKAPSEEKQYE